MRIIRQILGAIILLIDWIFTPRSIKREPELQAKIDEETRRLALYEFRSCPFCVKVRRALKRNTLSIDTRDVKRNDNYRDELLQGGGKIKVPCLRIEEQDGSVRWMYESRDIISYLESLVAKYSAA